MVTSRFDDSLRAEIGILGGTGLYEMDGVEDIREAALETPFGAPSDSYVIGRFGGRKVAFLSRHGRGHTILPSEINYRANIFGFKMLGVGRIISVNSVGSLKEELRPRDIVLADQFYDRTRRNNTFFGGGVVGHIGFAEPVCANLSEDLDQAARSLGLRVHPRGTYICIEGPSFSSRAESRIYRSWGCDVIGMTGATEARLCREAEICYAAMNMVTDYDVWHDEEEPVSVEVIFANLRSNVEAARSVLRSVIPALPEKQPESCGCGAALNNAVVTRPDLIPPERRTALNLLIGKYIGEDPGGRT